MNILQNARWGVLLACLSMLMLGACAMTDRAPDGHRLVLQGSQEVPPVNTAASGSGTITIKPDRSISGSITTTGINATAAHIHEAARGINGPVIVTLVRTSENVWSVPAGASLTESQYAAHRSGYLYVNVHSAAHPNGEIRGQIGGN